MSFEFDEAKSRENKNKHGIDFDEAQHLWLDPIAIMGPADSATEERFVFVGKIGATVWAAIVTFRGPNIRIISVRRARSEEREVYESE